MSKKHFVSFDVLRIIACFLVIVNHTIKDSFLNYALGYSEMFALAYLTLSKIAVPIFLMISGALLLSRKDSYRSVWKKRILPIVMVIILFSIFVYAVIEQREFSLLDWLSSMISEPCFVAYWYLYTLLGIYMVLPILQKLAQHLNKSDFKYIFILWFLFIGCFPFLANLKIMVPITTDFELPIFTAEIGYFILGYYLVHVQKLKEKKSMLFYFLVFISTLGICFGYNIWEYYHFGSYVLLLDRLSVWSSMIMAICVFQFFQIWNEKQHLSLRTQTWLKYIGETTFGIYLIHGITLWLTVDIQQYLLTSGNRVVGVLIYEVIIFVYSFILIRILALIPYMGNLLHIKKKNRTRG